MNKIKCPKCGTEIKCNTEISIRKKESTDWGEVILIAFIFILIIICIGSPDILDGIIKMVN